MDIFLSCWYFSGWLRQEEEEEEKNISVYLIRLKYLKNSLRLLLIVLVTQTWSKLKYRWNILNGMLINLCGDLLWYVACSTWTTEALVVANNKYGFLPPTEHILCVRQCFWYLALENLVILIACFSLLTYIMELNLWLVPGKTATKVPNQDVVCICLWVHNLITPLLWGNIITK